MTGRPIQTKAIAAAIAVLALFLASCSRGDDTDAERAANQVTVLTRNLYLGADLMPLFEATPADLSATVRATYDQMVASDIPARLDAVAGEIVDRRPDLVALQEASLWRVVPPGATSPDVLYDFVQLLLDDLDHRGTAYRVAATADGFSGGMPVEGVGLVTLLDRDVILVRSDSAVAVTKSETGTFTARLSLSVAGAPIEILRGWASVDAKVRGRTFRLIGTHLEAFDDPVRDQQQQELLAVADATEVPTLVLGDLNSAAQGGDSKAYDATLAAGFSDAWAKAPTRDGRETCCRTADLTGGSYDERIDFVLFRGTFDPLRAAVVGDGSASRTPSGRWSSDHGGVVAVLDLGA